MKGKVAAITGGRGTLGRGFIQGLLEAGATVYSLDRNIEASEVMVDEFRAQGYNVHAVSCDVLDEHKVQSALDTILANESKVDILINCAGGNMKGATVMPDQTVADISIEHFRNVTDLNVLGTVIPSIVFSKRLIDQQHGVIINISSMASFTPLTRVAGYSASKAAINNFTQWLAVELNQKHGNGIRVNAIAPGFFVAKQNRALLLNDDGSLTPRGETIISQTPMKRFGKAEDLISTLLWLCDDRSSFITGIVVPVDGGYSAFSGV